jgi:isoamyl acetate esterase
MKSSSIVSSTISSTTAPFRVRPSIVCFGDSITQYGYGNDGSDNVGWISLLSSAYGRRCDVFNRGFSGYNTRDAVQLIPRIFGSFPIVTSTNPYLVEENPHEGKLLFCTVFFGANDATIPGSNQYVPIDEYGQNIEKIIGSIRHTVNGGICSPNAVHDLPIIVLITPPPIDEVAWANFRNIDVSDRTNERARQYGLKLKDIANNYPNCEVLDTWELLQGESPTLADRSQHLYDGLHLSQSGNRLVFHGLMNRVVKDKYPHLEPMNEDDDTIKGKYGNDGIPVEEKLWMDLYA